MHILYAPYRKEEALRSARLAVFSRIYIWWAFEIVQRTEQAAWHLRIRPYWVFGPAAIKHFGGAVHKNGLHTMKPAATLSFFVFFMVFASLLLQLLAACADPDLWLRYVWRTSKELYGMPQATPLAIILTLAVIQYWGTSKTRRNRQQLWRQMIRENPYISAEKNRKF